MIRIAVCDDEEAVCQKLISLIETYFDGMKRAVWISDYRSGHELLQSNLCFDIIFMDIDMPGIDGIETAIKLRHWDVNSKIIYVTNYNRYKGSAYKVHAFDYIKKPVGSEELETTLNDAIRYLDHASKKQKCVFKTETGMITMEAEDIYYFEYNSRRVSINCSQGIYLASYRLKELYEKFHKVGFASPHKSFLVNMLHIKCIKGFDVIMENEDIIPLAQKKSVGFKAEFNDFLQSTFETI